MGSIKFDNTEILNGSYIPRNIKHETAQDRDLNILELARGNGSVLVSERRGSKIITLEGTITASSQALLETAIDNFKELFGRQAKNLDIDWGGATRRYVASCQEHNFDRDFFHLNFCPWTAKFVVPSGVGKDTTITAEKHNITINANPYAFTSTFAGSAKPNPVITLEISNAKSSPASGVELKNVTTGERIIYNKQSAFATNDTIVIDFANKKITKEGIEQGFYGVFPSLAIGANSLQLQFGKIIDQYSPLPSSISSFRQIRGDVQGAESFFVPYTDATYRSVAIFVNKDGTPADPLQVRIETDDGGKPSGTLVEANAHGTIAQADVGAVGALVNCDLTSMITLTAGVRYWIVCKMTTDDLSNKYNVGYFNKTYQKGSLAHTADGGTTWTEDVNSNLGFILYYGGVEETNPTYISTVVLDVDYYKEFL